MIKKLKIGLLVLAVFSVFGLVNYASAAALHWDADTTVTIGSNNYTIESGSEATSIAVSSTNLTVTIPASSTFTLTSPDKYMLDSSPGVEGFSCSSTESSLLITGAQTNIVITPEVSTCQTSTGGHHGSSSTTTSATPATPATPAVPGVSLAVPATPATPASIVKFAKPLSTKSLKADVKNLQSALNAVLGTTLAKPLVIDGKWGKMTASAVKAFQKANGLKGDGIMGPLSRAALNKLLNL